MLKLHLIFGISLLFVRVHYCQSIHQNILIDDRFSPEEPSICFNSKNKDNIVVGTNLNHLFQSEDGGYTWSKKQVKSSYGIWGDPVIACDTNGHFYFLHLSNDPKGNWIDRIVCQKSVDGGTSWSNGSFFGLKGKKAQDKHWMVVDNRTNFLHVTWTQFDTYGSKKKEDKSCIRYTRSTDGGNTWKKPIILSQKYGDCIDSDSTTEGAVPAIGPNGELYVSWAGPDGLVFDRSLDGGDTWLDTDINIDPMPGGWDYSIPGIYRSNGLPVTKCDLSSSPFRGSIFVNWSDQRMGENDTDVWIARSDDGGNHWSEPIRVNNDSAGSHQFLTWMDIDPITGYIYIVFYDRRNHKDHGTDVFMARSTDGGQSFTNFKISDNPFYPTKEIFFGDYNNIQVYGDQIRPVWTRLDSKKLSVMTAVIDPDAIKAYEMIDSTTNNLFWYSTDQNLYFSTGSYATKKAIRVICKGQRTNQTKTKNSFRIAAGNDLVQKIPLDQLTFQLEKIVLKKGCKILHTYRLD